MFTAIASYLDARHHGGLWRVRVDDLDKPREQPGAAENILRTLESLALEWDGPVVYQSDRIDLYRAHLDALSQNGHIFHCVCTRRQLRESGPVYPGTCRSRRPAPDEAAAMRLRVPNATIAFRDRFQGVQARHLAREDGDFVVFRRDRVPAYHLANVVDDAHDQVTHVLRGADLMGETPRHLLLHQLIGNEAPVHGHLSVIEGYPGSKLSKQTGAPGVHPQTPAEAARLTWWMLELLGLAPPAALERESPTVNLQWAAEHWHRFGLSGAVLAGWAGLQQPRR